MAIKDLIGVGIGFNPGSVKFLITRGLDIGSISVNRVIFYFSAIQQPTLDSVVSIQPSLASVAVTSAGLTDITIIL